MKVKHILTAIKQSKNKVVLLIVILLLISAFLVSGLNEKITFENLIMYRDHLINFVEENNNLAVLIFISTYIAMATLSLPGGIVLALSAGMIFGTVNGCIYVVIGDAIGAMLLFVIVRYLIGDFVQNHFKRKLEKFNNEVEKNGTFYLLTVRFMPVVSNTAIDLFSGLTKIKLFTFTWITFIGIIPGTLLYTFAGSKLRNVNSMEEAMSKDIFIIFTVMSLLGVIGIIIKKRNEFKMDKGH